MIDDLYRDLILEHYRHPRGAAPIEHADRRAEGQNPLCGDQCAVALAFDGDRVGRVAYRGEGCSISVASGSMMAGEIEGLPVERVRALMESVRAMLQGREPGPGVDLGDLEALQGVARFPVRVKCALLPWTTLEQALAGPPESGSAPRRGGDALSEPREGQRGT